MDRYICPKCKEPYITQETTGNFRCLGHNCGLTFSSKEYIPIASALLKVNHSEVLKYSLPEDIMNNIFKLLYSVKKTKEETLQKLAGRNICLEDLKELDKDGGLKLLLDI